MENDLLYQLLLPEIQEVADSVNCHNSMSQVQHIQKSMLKYRQRFSSARISKKMKRKEERLHVTKPWYSSMNLQSLLLQTLAQSRSRALIQVRLEKDCMWIHGTISGIDNDMNMIHLLNATETRLDNQGNFVSIHISPHYMLLSSSINQLELCEDECETPPLERIRQHIEMFEVRRLVRGDVDRFFREDGRYKQWLKKGGDSVQSHAKK